jgi:hypothetical protein
MFAAEDAAPDVPFDTYAIGVGALYLLAPRDPLGRSAAGRGVIGDGIEWLQVVALDLGE